MVVDEKKETKVEKNLDTPERENWARQALDAVGAAFNKASTQQGDSEDVVQQLVTELWNNFPDIFDAFMTLTKPDSRKSMFTVFSGIATLGKRLNKEAEQKNTQQEHT